MSLRTHVDRRSTAITTRRFTAGLANSSLTESGLTTADIRYIVSSSGTHVLTADEFAWGILLNNAATTIQFPTLTVIKSVAQYSGVEDRMYTYRIVNDQGSTCTVTVGTGGTVPVAVTIPATSFAVIYLIVGLTSYQLYAGTGTGGAAGFPYGTPQPQWPDLVTPASLIPSPSYYILRDPGTVTGGVSNAVVQTVSDGTPTKLYCLAWSTDPNGAASIRAMAVSYNTVTAAYTFGAQTLIDTYTNSIGAGVLGVASVPITITPVDATSALIAYFKDFGGLSTLNVVKITITGTTITVGTPVTLATDAIGIPVNPQQAQYFPFGYLIAPNLFVYGYNTTVGIFGGKMVLVDMTSGSPVVSSPVNATSAALVTMCVISSTTVAVVSYDGTVYITYIVLTTTPFAVVSRTTSTIDTVGISDYDATTLLNMDGTLFVLNLNGYDQPGFPIAAHRYLLTRAADVFTVTVSSLPAELRTLAVKTSATTFATCTRLNNLSTATTPTIRTYTVNSSSITESANITMNPLPASNIGNIYPMWMTTMNSGTGFYIVDIPAPTTTPPRDAFTISTDVYVMAGTLSPLAKMTVTKPTYLTPYGGGVDVAIVPAATMAVELLPNVSYFSHTYDGSFSDYPGSDPSNVGDIGDAVGNTGADRELLTFV